MRRDEGGGGGKNWKEGGVMKCSKRMSGPLEME